MNLMNLTIATKKSLTTSTTCRKCGEELVLARTSKKVVKGIYQCPVCGSGIKYVWKN